MTTRPGNRIGIVDYGVGNLGSLRHAMALMRIEADFLTDPAQLAGAERIILPGVGNFADCAARLRHFGWSDAIRAAVRDEGKPLLGICVGMQLLATDSTEGNADTPEPRGLDLIPGHVRHLRDLGSGLRVPHVGWNAARLSQPADRFFVGIPDDTDYYFVHSFAFVPEDPDDVLAETEHGVPFACAIRRGHVFGTQFHPEKSSRAGLRVLRNFAETSWL